MKITYNVYDMIHDLKLGIWQGGEIQKLGYVGAVMHKQHYQKLENNRYLAVSYDTFVDTTISTTNKTGMTLKICIYHPYNREYIAYCLPTEISLVDFMNTVEKLAK